MFEKGIKNKIGEQIIKNRYCQIVHPICSDYIELISPFNHLNKNPKQITIEPKKIFNSTSPYSIQQLVDEMKLLICEILFGKSIECEYSNLLPMLIPSIREFIKQKKSGESKKMNVIIKECEKLAVIEREEKEIEMDDMDIDIDDNNNNNNNNNNKLSKKELLKKEINQQPIQLCLTKLVEKKKWITSNNFLFHIYHITKKWNETHSLKILQWKK